MGYVSVILGIILAIFYFVSWEYNGNIFRALSVDEGVHGLILASIFIVGGIIVNAINKQRNNTNNPENGQDKNGVSKNINEFKED
jgi:NADH:ubiquinone oxidoreductase subunit 4 (subunit M)